jgi:uncharacterized protein
MSDTAKTKRVDGEDLTADCFLIVGDKDDTSTWKLPWKFSTEEKTKSHLRNALARFNQLTGVSEEDKKKAWTKLVSLCKKYGIEVSDDNKKSLERRIFKVEVRKAGDADSRKIRGTAVVFNQRSENLGGFVEQIDPAALDGADMSDVRALFNHDENRVLGRTGNKTLTLTKDSQGLHFEVDPPDTSYARDLANLMDRGDIDQCSFSFTVAPGGAQWDEDSKTGVLTRTVNKISRLFDVSVVTFPAYTATSAELRSAADILGERQPDPPASSGGVDADLLRRKLELAYYQHL